MRLLALAAFLAALLAVSSTAHSSQEAAWIGQGRYLSFTGIHCCGVMDCEVAPEGAVIEVPEGYKIVDNGQIVSFASYGRGLHWSIDSRYWWCRRYNATTGELEAPHCLFVPGVGT